MRYTEVKSRRRWIFPSRFASTRLPVVIPSLLKQASASVLALLFPDDCRICQKPLREASRIPVCSECLRLPQPFSAAFFCRACRTPFLTEYPLDQQGLCGVCRRGWSGFQAAYSFGEYAGALRKLIHLFKYEKIKPLAGPLGRMLAQALPRDERIDLIVPMPLHWRRRWQRGFNQSMLLARELSRQTGLPVGQVVRRRKQTTPQAGLADAQRRRNVAGAFFVPHSEAVRGKRILLIDDVLTTGATSRVCAAALHAAGAERVIVLTIARVDRRLGRGQDVLLPQPAKP